MSLNNRDYTNGQLQVLMNSCHNLTSQVDGARNYGTLSEKAETDLNEAKLLLYKVYRLIDSAGAWNLPGIYDDTKEG